jgi:cell division protein FtsL
MNPIKEQRLRQTERPEEEVRAMAVRQILSREERMFWLVVAGSVLMAALILARLISS